MTAPSALARRNSKHSDDFHLDAEKTPESIEDEYIQPEYTRAGLSAEDAQFLSSISQEEQRRIFHKVDWRLIPILALLYLIAHLDRANIGNAKIEGLEASLGMTGTDYNAAVAVFFIPYVLCEVPSNLLLSKFSRASWYLGALVICWGLVMTFTGFVQNFSGLAATRFLLGIFEAGFFPGAIWITSQWYPPAKSQTRMAMFYLSSALAGAFSGLAAAGIAKMNGVGGLEGWRWIFIIEGIASVACGVLCIFALPDSPVRATAWLSEDEIRFLSVTHRVTRGASAKKAEGDNDKKHFRWTILWTIIKDWQLYLQALVMASNSVPNYALKVTMPQIIKNMGFTSTTAQLLTAPPYALGAVSAIVAALFADRLTWRAPFILGAQSLLVIAYSILTVKAVDITHNVALCYSCVCLACIGIYPIIPGTLSWTINNLAGAEKRAMGIAYMMAYGNSGAIVGSFIFLEKEKPRYTTGFAGSLSFACAGIIAAMTLELLYWTSNKRNERYTEEEIRAKYTEDQLEKMGDRSPLFKYSL